MKRFLSMTLAFSLSLLTACSGGDNGTTAGTSDNATDNNPSAQVEVNSAYSDIKIGIVQLAEHPALDDSTQGFIDTLLEAGFPQGNIDLQNAQGEQATCSTIANKFVTNKVDLILAVATPAAQSAANATSDIPVLATAVTDFPVAGLIAENVTGVSDMGPVERQVELVLEVAPEAETIGVLYCSSEDNSRLQADMAFKVLQDLGVDYLEFTVADSNEVQSVVQSMIGKVDAIYVPTDNLLAQTMATVVMITNPAGVPVIVGEAGMVASGGLATIGVDYYGLGVATANQAIRIFEGEDVASIEVEFSDENSWEPAVNQETLEALGIELPDSLKEG